MPGEGHFRCGSGPGALSVVIVLRTASRMRSVSAGGGDWAIGRTGQRACVDENTGYYIYRVKDFLKTLALSFWGCQPVRPSTYLFYLSHYQDA